MPYTVNTENRTLTQGTVSTNALLATALRVSAHGYIPSKDAGAIIWIADAGTPGPGWRFPVNQNFDILGILNAGLPAAERYVGTLRMLYDTGTETSLTLFTVEGIWTP